MSFKEMITSKMFWLGVAAIAGSVSGFIYKQIDMPTMIAGIAGGLGMIFAKDAIVKSGPTGGVK